MDFVQGPITTLHRLEDGQTTPPTRPFAAVIPMSGDDVTDPAAIDVIEAVESLGPTRIVVPVRAAAGAVARLDRRLNGSAATELLWCNAPPVRSLVDQVTSAPFGKGGDVWLGVGLAMADAEVICCLDADVSSIDTAAISHLLGAIDGQTHFAKAYYARVEADGLYGRLFRLFVRPLLFALQERHDGDLLRYLTAFRYALAGEFAVDSSLVRDWSFPPGMGLEMGLLGEAYTTAGPSRTAQVDLGLHRHTHRPVDGPSGLEMIAPTIAGTVFHVLETHGGIRIDTDGLEAEYRSWADRLITSYERDAGFNGLPYDAAAERQQVDRYAPAISEPVIDTWVAPWAAVDLDPDAIRSAGRQAIDLRAD